jgi:MoaA/NifB/PqqE/SkfB family radical SAM enzyme
MGESTHTPVQIEDGSMNALLDQLIKLGPKVTKNAAFRKTALAMAEKWMINDGKNRHKNDPATPPGVIDDQTAFNLAMLKTVERILADGKISDATYAKASQVLGRDLLVEKKDRKAKSDAFREKYGYVQPAMILLSPSKACNLRCTGCYADSDASLPHLEWDLVDQIITDARNLWGAQFVPVSGGEPLAYRSQGKDLLDLVEKHPDVYFLMYTNSTLITPEIADRMGKLGNILPCISLEGWEERTDARRGKGIFQKVMKAMDLLHEAGVIYGTSLTATRENAEELLSDDFIDFLFDTKHVSLGWIFQYMPIGRSFTLDLMPTPQQRIWMWQKSWNLVREKQIFLADFWNHGSIVDGCISAGGHGKGGYLYIEWNGNVTPCAFVPYSPVNVKDIYAKGGNINDIYQEGFFKDIRDWQNNRSITNQNLLAPCPIRDHNAMIRQLMRKHEVNPIDNNAAQAIQDGNYAAGMDHYDEVYNSLADQVWQKYYIEGKPISDEEISAITGVPELTGA